MVEYIAIFKRDKANYFNHINMINLKHNQTNSKLKNVKIKGIEKWVMKLR